MAIFFPLTPPDSRALFMLFIEVCTFERTSLRVTTVSLVESAKKKVSLKTMVCFIENLKYIVLTNESE